MIRVSSFNLFIGVYFFYTGFKVKVSNDLFNDKAPVAITGCASATGWIKFWCWCCRQRSFSILPVKAMSERLIIVGLKRLIRFSGVSFPLRRVFFFHLHSLALGGELRRNTSCMLAWV